MIIDGPKASCASKTVNFDVYFEGIQDSDVNDVTVNFKAWDLQNTDEVFYTDSNSLEFMRREIDVYSKRYNTTT